MSLMSLPFNMSVSQYEHEVQLRNQEENEMRNLVEWFDDSQEEENTVVNGDEVCVNTYEDLVELIYAKLISSDVSDSSTTSSDDWLISQGEHLENAEEDRKHW